MRASPRLLSFNCQHAYRPKGLEDFLAQQAETAGVSVFLLQEVNDAVSEILGRHESLRGFWRIRPFHPDNARPSELAILYRKEDMELWKNVTLHSFAGLAGETGERVREKFGLLLASFETDDGPLILWNVQQHPWHRFGTRAKETEFIARTTGVLARARPDACLLIAGDFNIGSDREAHGVAERMNRENFIHASTGLGHTAHAARVEPTSPMNRAGRLLARMGAPLHFYADHIFTNFDGNGVARADAADASDHDALRCDLPIRRRAA